MLQPTLPIDSHADEAEPRDALPPASRAPLWVLVGTLLLTGLSAFYVFQTTRSQAKSRYENAIHNAVREVRDQIDARLHAYTALLRGGAGLFAADSDVTSDEFSTYVARLELRQNYSGVQGIGFAKRAPGAIERYLITYLLPADARNSAAMGFDMFSEATRRAAMIEARDRGQPAATGRIILRQEIDDLKQPGFLICVPVYRGGHIPATVEARRRDCTGFVYCPFRAGDLLGKIANGEPLAVTFEVYDGPDPTPPHLLYNSISAAPVAKAVDMQPLEVASRAWTLVFRPRDPFVATTGFEPALFTLIGGCIVSLMLFLAARSQAAARRGAELSAARLRRSERALRERETQLRRLFDSNIIGTVVADFEGRIIEANDAFLNLIGYSRRDLAEGRINWAELTPPDQLHLDRNAIEQMRATGRHDPYEKEYIRRDGTRVPVLVGIAYLAPTGSEREIGVGFIVDLTDLKRAQQSVKESEQRFRMMADNAPALIWTCDSEGQRTYFNKPWLDFTGRQIEQEIGYGWLQSVHPDDRDRWIDIYNVALRKREPMEIEYRLRRQDGVYRWILARAMPRFTLSGDFEGLVGICQDHTQRKQAEDERSSLLESAQAASAEAEAANRAKDEFLATISHELRTPLNSILGWAQLLRLGAVEGEEVVQGLETIERNAKAQAQLVDDLLDVSRIISGKLRLDVKSVDLPQVIAAALETVQPAADAKGIRVVPVLDKRAGPLMGDAGRLQQVVWNLLSNAIKFTPRDGQVQVWLRRVDESAEITVSDTGQGIAPEFLPHVFERLRQADSSSTRRHGGLGLGLAIVRHLVEQHGGTVHAESRGPGKGSTFTVILPLAMWRGDGDHPISGSLLDGISNETGAATLLGLRVLAVDDEPDARSLVKRVLRLRGAEVTVAGSADEAIQAMRRDPFDVLLSDIGMPGADGYCLLGRVRALSAQQGAQIPAIALTAFARVEDRKRALDAGFQSHISKPIAPDELAMEVARVVGRIAESTPQADPI